MYERVDGVMEAEVRNENAASYEIGTPWFLRVVMERRLTSMD